MKRILIVSLLILTLSLTAFLTACADGERGEPGIQGEKGEQGEAGKDGIGVAGVQVVDGEIIVSYTDGREESLGNVGEIMKTDDLIYYPLDDGTYAVGIGNSVYLSEIVIPEEHNGRPVSTIAYNGFAKSSNLRKITIPKSVKTIDANAFYNCKSLNTVNIPNDIEVIGEDAFYGCTNLACNEDGLGKYLGSEENPYIILVGVDGGVAGSLTVNKNARFIHSGAFSGCQLTEVVIGENIKYIGSGVFTSCTRLESLTLPFLGDGGSEGHVGYVFGASSFSYNGSKVPASLKNVTILSAEEISDDAFNSCKYLEKIVLPENVKSIGKRAFYNCTNLADIEIPKSVTKIGDYAFFNCLRITNIEIPEGVRTISENSFRSCVRLETVELPDSITYIGYAAFYGCEALKRIYIPISVERIENDAFRGCTVLAIYCQAEKRPKGWNIDWNYSDCTVVWGWKY